MSYFNIKRFARTAFWMYRINVKNVLSFAAGLSFGTCSRSLAGSGPC